MKRIHAVLVMLSLVALHLGCQSKMTLPPAAPGLINTPTSACGQFTCTFTYTSTPTLSPTRTTTPSPTVTFSPTITATFSCSSGSGTFGNPVEDTHGSTTAWTQVQRFNLPVDGRVVRIRLDQCFPSPATIIAGIYADNAGYPTTLIGAPITQITYNATCGGLNTTLNYPGQGVALRAGYYWLGETSSVNTSNWGWLSTGTGPNIQVDTGGVLPQSFPPYQFAYNFQSLVIVADWVCP